MRQRLAGRTRFFWGLGGRDNEHMEPRIGGWGKKETPVDVNVGDCLMEPAGGGMEKVNKGIERPRMN